MSKWDGAHPTSFSPSQASIVHARIASPAPAPPSSLFRTGRFGTDKHPFYDPENPFSGTAAGHAERKRAEQKAIGLLVGNIVELALKLLSIGGLQHCNRLSVSHLGVT